MKLRFRRGITASSWLDLLGLGATYVVSVRADEAIPVDPLENSAAASPNLKFLPENYWLTAELGFASCNVSSAWLTPQRNPQYAQFKQMLQMAKAIAGIDLEKEVDRVTVFLAGDPDREPQYLFVVQGTFDNRGVEARLTQNFGKAMSAKTYKETTVYAGSEWRFLLRLRRRFSSARRR